MGNIPGAAEIGGRLTESVSSKSGVRIVGAMEHARRGKISSPEAGKNSTPVGWRETTSGLLVPNSGEMTKYLSGDKKAPAEANNSQVNSEAVAAPDPTGPQQADADRDNNQLADARAELSEVTQDGQQEASAPANPELRYLVDQQARREAQSSNPSVSLKSGRVETDVTVPDALSGQNAKDYRDALEFVILANGLDPKDEIAKSNPAIIRQALDIYYYRRAVDLVSKNAELVKKVTESGSLNNSIKGIRDYAESNNEQITEEEIINRALAQYLEGKDRKDRKGMVATLLKIAAVLASYASMKALGSGAEIAKNQK